jgi:hypothetical protein
MYAVGARAQSDVLEAPALAPVSQFAPGGTLATSRFVASPQPAVVRVAEPAPRIVQASPAPVVRETRSGRSWQKSALIIGGAAASGAGVGGIISGKKGALIGAAVGGGAASIYEASKR